MLHAPEPVPYSDEDLACRARQGCATSFDQLMRRFQVPVLQFLRHRDSFTDAEDLAQETFVRAYENLHRYRPKWRFASWLFTIARRVSINHHRRSRPVADCEALESVQSPAPGPPQVALEKESRRQLWAVAAETLSEEQMTATWLHYVEDMPLGQIAWVLGRSRAAVKTMMFRARKKLLPLLRESDLDGSSAAGGRIARAPASRLAEATVEVTNV